jgi:hypothetical protein
MLLSPNWGILLEDHSKLGCAEAPALHTLSRVGDEKTVGGIALIVGNWSSRGLPSDHDYASTIRSAKAIAASL